MSFYNIDIADKNFVDSGHKKIDILKEQVSKVLHHFEKKDFLGTLILSVNVIDTPPKQDTLVYWEKENVDMESDHEEILDCPPPRKSYYNKDNDDEDRKYH